MMNKPFHSSNRAQQSRHAGVALIAAIVLFVLLGFTALAIDVGYLMLSQTQMQAANDASTLGGGTELMPGLGRFAIKTPAEVATASRPVAKEFARLNRAADLTEVYVDENRDVEFGTAVMNPADGTWNYVPGAVPYNAIKVTVNRNQTGSSSGDGPIPLFFARVMGHDESSLMTDSTAVILPADGFTVTEPGEASGIMPFAFKEKVWRRLEDTQNWLDANNGVMPSPMDTSDPNYPWYDDDGDSNTPDVPMFHRHAYDNQGNLLYEADGVTPIWEQDLYDNFNATPAYSPETASVVGTAPPAASSDHDGVLEVNLYPESTGGAITAGNAGTIDLGDTNNAAQAIADQILDGLSYDDYQEMESQGLLNADGELAPEHSNPTWVNGDTGISGGPIQQAMDQIIGQTRAIALYTQGVAGPGNNVQYPLVEFVGVRVLYARMSGNPKSIWIQPAPHQDGTAVPDYDEVPGPDTTVFTPLILIE